jgi:hypothetical protein
MTLSGLYGSDEFLASSPSLILFQGGERHHEATGYTLSLHCASHIDGVICTSVPS